MGDNIFLGDRDGVRTPMQWSFDRNGGFSRADPARLYLPPIMDPVYGFEAVNVEAQSRSPVVAAELDEAADRGAPLASRFRPRHLALSLSRRTARSSPICAPMSDEIILCVANLSRSPQAVELDLSEFRGPRAGRAAWPQHLPADRRSALSADPARAQLFLVRALACEPLRRRRTCNPQPPEFVTLVMPQGWADLFRPHNLAQLESDVIPAFCRASAGSAPRTSASASVSVAAHGEIVGRRKVARQRKPTWRPWPMPSFATRSGSIISCRSRDLVGLPRRELRQGSLRSRSPNCASSAARAPSSMRCRRTGSSWR